jgi:hypothetical protein
VTTMKQQPLWLQRIVLVMLLPLLLIYTLIEAATEGWHEFWWELKRSAKDVADIWMGR